MQGGRNFYPRPPRGGRHKTGELALWDEEISIHALREEGDAHVVGGLAFCDEISIHALREEGDMEAMAWLIFRGYFYPRPPRGGRP